MAKKARTTSSCAGEPLGLPKGSVRSIITILSLIVYFTAMFLSMIFDKIIPETLNSIVITVVAFYFGVRSAESSREE